MTAPSIMPLIQAAFLSHLGRITYWIFMAVILITAVIGFLYVTRGTAVRRVRGVGIDGTPVFAHRSTFEHVKEWGANLITRVL